MDQENRIVVLIDMDCFYCQVEEKLNPELRGKPIAVVQYNPWKGGGILAVNYIARAMGVTRHMRGDEAKEKCPDIELPSVPCHRGKADITKYRDAGKEVAKVLQKFTTLLERASIDEAYLDITCAVQARLKTTSVNSIMSVMVPNTYALGYDSIDAFISDVHSGSNDSINFDYENVKHLLVGAAIVSEIRAAVYEETGYRCSAGIAHNKILAKLVCGMNKPNKQTILPKHSVNILYETLSIKKVKHLGGKFGDTVCEKLKIKTMGELQRFREKELQIKFDEKSGTWLYNIARGIDEEPVQARFNSKSIGCCKQFRGKAALTDLDSLTKWLKDLGDEIEDRLEKDSLENNRTPKQMVVSFSTQLINGKDTSSSRSYNFQADDRLCEELFSNKALELILESTEGVKPKDGESNRRLKASIKFLGISVGKFEDNSESKKTKKILDYFGASSSKDIKEEVSCNMHVKNKNDAATSSNSNMSKRADNKEYILQKFFQANDKGPFKLTGNVNEVQTYNKSLSERPLLQATLDNQESFFAKFLNNKSESDPQNQNEIIHPTIPVCNVVNCGDDSNDTDYSGSTINQEINKSIALFEDDPDKIERVSNIRNLLNNSKMNNKNEMSKGEEKNNVVSPKNSPINYEMIVCPDCGKRFSVHMFGTHADYHLALKLKEEDRLHRVSDMANDKNKKNDNIVTDKNKRMNHINEDKQFEGMNENENSVISDVKTFKCNECGKTLPESVCTTHADYHLALKLREDDRRQARDEKTATRKLTETKKDTDVVKKKQLKEQRCETTTSIASFIIKIDSNIPIETCLECGKKVPVEKIMEHLDFHEAQKLSRELNKSSIIKPVNLKRKRKSLSPIKKSKLPCKSIDSFFR